MTAHELPFLKKSAPGPFKITLPAPSNFVVSSYKPGVSEPVLSHACRAACRIWSKSSATKSSGSSPKASPTFSSTRLTIPTISIPIQREQRRTRWRESRRGIGRKPSRGDNPLLDDIPRNNVTVAVHVCRGNSRSRWYTEGGYDAIAEKLFGIARRGPLPAGIRYRARRQLRACCASCRADKRVVLGLVTTKEPQPRIAGRLCAAASTKPRATSRSKISRSARNAASPPSPPATCSPLDDQWRKLELVVNTARKVWGTT